MYRSYLPTRYKGQTTSLFIKKNNKIKIYSRGFHFTSYLVNWVGGKTLRIIISLDWYVYVGGYPLPSSFYKTQAWL